MVKQRNKTQQFDLADLSSPITKTKYRCSKEALKISQTEPHKLYAHLAVWENLLNSDNQILLWTAIIIIGNLAEVDQGHKIEALIPKLVSLFHAPSMITSSNAIIALCKIAKHNLAQREKIISDLLQVEKMSYLNKGKVSPECQNIAIGHLLDGLKMFEREVLTRADVAGFMQRQIHNTRPAVARRAVKLVRLISA